MVTITEDYVSFEVAKLLKEKGFDGKCDKCYAYFADDDIRILNLKYPKSSQLLSENRYPCVTLQMAMKWFRKVYNIIIKPEPVWNGKKWEYQLFIVTPQNAASPYYEHNPYKSYEKCVEAGIKYYLENMI